MPIGQYLEAGLLDRMFSQAAIAGFPPANLYFGLSTQAVSGATQATILSGEPTATGSYARVGLTNNNTNFPAAVTVSAGAWSAANSLATAYKFAATAVAFPQSSAAWSTGATALTTLFVADASTLAGGNVYWYGAITPSTLSVNAANVTISFTAGGTLATASLVFTLT